jgi:hypothetical protein
MAGARRWQTRTGRLQLSVALRLPTASHYSPGRCLQVTPALDLWRWSRGRSYPRRCFNTRRGMIGQRRTAINDDSNQCASAVRYTFIGGETCSPNLCRPKLSCDVKESS